MTVVMIVDTTMTMIVKGRGRIRYSPTNNGKIERRDGGTTTWWVVIDVSPEIGRYYRELYRLDSFNVRTINRPTWDAHISIVTNEEPPNKTFWRSYERKWIDFEYVHKPDSNGVHVWLPVICPAALDLREELGLKRDPYYPLHLTVGNNKEQDAWTKDIKYANPAKAKEVSAVIFQNQ
jgi:hypothetical protein